MLPRQFARAAEPSAEEKAVRQTAQAFTDAFNKGDAKAVAALWAPDGDYSIGRDTVKGRDAIQKLYEEFFKAHPGSKMEINVESVRVYAPTVAIEQGTASVTESPNGPPTASAYSAVHVKQKDGKWLMASVSESEMPTLLKQDLSELSWLIGDWIAEQKRAESRRRTSAGVRRHSRTGACARRAAAGRPSSRRWCPSGCLGLRPEHPATGDRRGRGDRPPRARRTSARDVGADITLLRTLGSGLYARVLAQLELTQMYLDEGRRGEATTCFGQAIDLVESSFGGRGGRNWLGRVGTQLALANGDLDQAQHWSCTIDDAFWAPVSRARVELASDHRRQALDSLDDAVARCVRHEVVLDLIRSRALVNHDEAVNLAGSAAERAARVGLVQSVASEGADCLRLIELVAWRVPESWLAQVRRAPTGGGPGPVPARQLVESLTDREHEVLRLLPTRLTLHEIADELFISMNTLKFHLKVIYRKLGCGSRAEAADAARELAHSHGSGQPSATLRR